MIPARRWSAAPALLMTLIFGALLGLALLQMKVSAHPTAAHFGAPSGDIVITAVSTVSHTSSPVSSPSALPTSAPVATTLLAGLGVETDSSSAAGESTSLPTIPGPLVDPNLSLLTGPVDVPLEIHIPALEIIAPVMGVGLTENNAMASPRGILEDDPLWQTVFWYRGGGIPGDVGMATFAGHYDDALGRPAIFAYLDELGIGNLIIVRDERSGLNIPFIVTETQTYTEEEAADPAVLARIFGTDSVSGADLLPMSNQLSQLSLITCGGTWIDGSFNLRLVVYATRASYPF